MADESKSQLTEADVRRIVDERIGEVLKSLKKEADDRSIGLASYEVGELARSAFSAFSDLVGEEISKLTSKEGE